MGAGSGDDRPARDFVEGTPKRAVSELALCPHLNANPHHALTPIVASSSGCDKTLFYSHRHVIELFDSAVCTCPSSAHCAS